MDFGKEVLIALILIISAFIVSPGYGGLNPKAGLFQGLASFQAIIGTLMWATFIATFSRKFMR
jgi:hypothetical protein